MLHMCVCVCVCVCVCADAVLVPQVEDIMKREGVSFDEAKVRMASGFRFLLSSFLSPCSLPPGQTSWSQTTFKRVCASS